MTTFYLYTIYLTLYSLLGWVMETIVCSVEEKHFVNRGFLNGPFCPVYGFGAVLIIVILRPLSQNIPVVFVAGILLTSAVEYFTGYLLERIFAMKWWDYSDRFLNIKGRVCLTNALAFGVLAVLLLHYIHPALEMWVARMPSAVLPWVAWILIAYFLLDTALSTKAALTLKGKLAKIQQAFADLEEKRQAYTDAMAAMLEYRKAKAAEMLEIRGHAYREALTESVEQKKAQAMKRLEAAKEQYEALLVRPQQMHKRFLAAFPNLSSAKHQHSVLKMREAIKAQWQMKREKKNE